MIVFLKLIVELILMLFMQNPENDLFDRCNLERVTINTQIDFRIKQYHEYAGNEYSIICYALT